MGLLDLDKITVHRTVIGIRCTTCEGNLVPQKLSLAVRLIKWISFGKLQPRKYECEHCKKQHTLF